MKWGSRDADAHGLDHWQCVLHLSALKALMVKPGNRIWRSRTNQLSPLALGLLFKPKPQELHNLCYFYVHQCVCVCVLCTLETWQHHPKGVVQFSSNPRFSRSAKTCLTPDVLPALHWTYETNVPKTVSQNTVQQKSFWTPFGQRAEVISSALQFVMW